MADNILQVQCFKCQTVYEVPFDMVGQIVECAICNSIFDVPSPIPGRESEINATFPYVMPEVPAPPPAEASFDIPEEIVASSEQAANVPDNITHPPDKLETSVELNSSTPAVTNTVKLSRSSIGMMPKIEDHFGFGTMQQKTTKASTANPENDEDIEITEITDIKPGNSVKKDPAAKFKNCGLQAQKPPQGKKWWKFWLWFRK